MTDDIPITDAEAADLAALADGRLAPERDAEVRARVAGDPRLSAELARQQTVLRLVHAAAAETYAPLALRERIETARTRPAKRGRQRWWLPAGVAASLAAVVAVLVVVLGGGSLTVPDTLAFATQPATIGVTINPETPQLLEEEVDDVPFPNYRAKFGWTATGAREDTQDGQRTKTVFYVKDRRRIAYTIVGGQALDEPAGRASTVLGTPLITFRDDARTAVTWLRGGQTCVLSGVGVSAGELQELAAWKGKGNVPF